MALNALVEPDLIRTRGQEVVRLEMAGLAALESAIDENFVAACQLILNIGQRLVVTGMGKSGHVGRKIAATFAATGTPSIYIHPGEAAHGDMGMLVPGDALLVLSNSGNTPELRAILAYGRNAGIPIVGVASHLNSLVMEHSDIQLLLPQVQEACSVSLAPTTSTTMQLALGDALAMAVMTMRGVGSRQIHAFHPAGTIGLTLCPVMELAHRGEAMPLVAIDARMQDVISIMTMGRFGLTGVMNGERLAGVITDGDLRRHFAELGTARAAEVMTANPKVLPGEMPAGEALAFLNEHKITAAFVVADPAAGPQVPLGIIHIHDLLRHGLG